jgi:hypothetical protein
LKESPEKKFEMKPLSIKEDKKEKEKEIFSNKES